MPQNLMKRVGARIKGARERANLTQLELAHAIGFQGDNAGAYVCRVESGSMQPRLETLLKMAKCLGTSVEELLA